jgi:ABC-type sulfate transport system substrate-binding protein
MKKVHFVLAALLFLAAFSPAAYSQADSDGNVFHVATFKFQMPEGGSWAEFDSLTALVTKNVTSKQNKIVSQRMLRHLWGSDNRELVVITEYRKIEDLVGEDTDGETLFAAAWSSDDKQKEFNKAYNKYWRAEHKDEIYSEVKSGRK